MGGLFTIETSIFAEFPTLARFHLHSACCQVLEMNKLHHENLPIILAAFRFLDQFDLSSFLRRQLSSTFHNASPFHSWNSPSL
jgi:hypothetical protein